nr:ribosome maturation factor RimP [Desulfobulbaceae bacterium]
MESTTVVKIQEIIEPVLASLGYELVEVQLRTEQIGLVLRVIIYKDGGISVDDCSAVSREVGPLLEVEDIISRAYHLEVSSPGLDRPLKTERDFTRNTGKKIKLTFIDPEQSHATVIGVVKSCENERLEIEGDNGMHVINLVDVTKAKLVIEF